MLGMCASGPLLMIAVRKGSTKSCADLGLDPCVSSIGKGSFSGLALGEACRRSYLLVVVSALEPAGLFVTG